MITGRKVPHPIPYQGSKRNLTQHILRMFPSKKIRLFEPFAGSAALSIAATVNGMVKSIVLNDANVPLMELWKRIIHEPEELTATYARLWQEQQGDEKTYYNKIRDEFNATHDPDLFFYLLARCIKASVRYNANGEFNQSPDNRRKGAKPSTMKKHVMGASLLLKNITEVKSGDFRQAIIDANEDDLIYMDPPYQGVCGKKDNRYFEGLSFDDFVESLFEMNRNDLSYIISYDGRTGVKKYGKTLPTELNLDFIEIDAGRSSQATLLGRKENTIESLYLSPALTNRLNEKAVIQPPVYAQPQLALF